jgi:hypothetical protein
VGVPGKPSQTDSPKTGGKGRPTPKRRQAEAARKRPLGGAGSKPTTPLTKEQQKEARRKARERYDHAMRTGDERYLPERDKGPVRRYTRDWVDARRSVGEYMVFLALGSLIGMMAVGSVVPQLTLPVLALLYLMVFVLIGDAAVRGRRLKRALIEKFGQDKLGRGDVWYGVNRSMQMRRSRMPHAQVQRGEFPD